MTDYNKIYEELKKQYTDEEIADFAMIPSELSEEEKQKSKEEFLKLRMERRASMSQKDKLLSALLSIKYQIKNYVKADDFKPSNSFGNFLQRYMKTVERKQKDFAEDINLHPSRLNRILKGKEKIGVKIAYRLEEHSGNIIPAIFWWKLMQKEIEEEILTEKEVRELEKKKVKYIAYQA